MQKLVFDFRARKDIHENNNCTKFSLIETVIKTLRFISYYFNKLIITRCYSTRLSKSASHYSVFHSVDSLHLQHYIKISHETLQRNSDLRRARHQDTLSLILWVRIPCSLLWVVNVWQKFSASISRAEVLWFITQETRVQIPTFAETSVLIQVSIAWKTIMFQTICTCNVSQINIFFQVSVPK
jgi:hypothetical protein